jgi:predicted nucleic acid-binding protein
MDTRNARKSHDDLQQRERKMKRKVTGIIPEHKTMPARTSMSVYEEVFFVGLRLIAEDAYSITSTAELKAHIRREGYTFADEFIRNMNEVFADLMIVPDSSNLIRIEDIARSYALLPNDALIVATCRDHAIPHIASFDRDFSRVKDPVRIKN